MTAGRLFIDGIAFWATGLPGWEAARAAFRGAPADGARAAAPVRPEPELLAPIQRRRAPDTVALALEVASAAVRQAGQDAAQLPSVFVSAHGDLVINDTMCRTLAEAPAMVSPTKFHNSVHNAASGYWTMSTGCMQASTALTAFEHSFAAGLLEAAAQCTTDARPVLLVGYDIEARGALRCVVRSRGLVAAALVLAPCQGARSVAVIEWSLRPGPTKALRVRSAAARALAHNAMFDAVPLMEALAQRQPESLLMPLSSLMALRLEIAPL